MAVCLSTDPAGRGLRTDSREGTAPASVGVALVPVRCCSGRANLGKPSCFLLRHGSTGLVWHRCWCGTAVMPPRLLHNGFERGAFKAAGPVVRAAGVTLPDHVVEAAGAYGPYWCGASVVPRMSSSLVLLAGRWRSWRALGVSKPGRFGGQGKGSTPEWRLLSTRACQRDLRSGRGSLFAPGGAEPRGRCYWDRSISIHQIKI